MAEGMSETPWLGPVTGGLQPSRVRAGGAGVVRARL